MSTTVETTKFRVMLRVGFRTQLLAKWQYTTPPHYIHLEYSQMIQA